MGVRSNIGRHGFLIHDNLLMPSAPYAGIWNTAWTDCMQHSILTVGSEGNLEEILLYD